MAGNELPPRAQRVLEHWANIAQAAYEKVGGQIAADHSAKVNALAEQLEQELAPALAPIVQHILDNAELPPELRGLLEPLLEPTQLGQSLILGIVAGAAVSPMFGAALAPAVQIVANAVWPLNQVMPLSGAELAAAVLKGVISLDEGVGTARLVGYDAHNFQLLTEIAGQAIGIEEALLLWRRGQISEAELDRIIHYSNVRTDFAPDIKLLKFLPPGAGEVVAGRLKQHLSQTEYLAKLSNAGIDPTEADWLLATAGRPYGTMEGLELLNRGLITEDRFRQVVAQSDINTDFTDDLLNLRVHYPPARTIVPLIRANAITDAQATTLLEYQGIPADLAAAYIKEGHTTRTTALRELSVAQTLRAYEDQLIDGPTAIGRIVGRGYPQADAELMLEISDTAREERFRDAAVNHVRVRFLAHKLTAGEVQSALTALKIPGAAATAWLELWTLERQSVPVVLTLAQAQGAYHREIITLTEFIAHAHALGYSGMDVKIVAAEAWPPTRVPAEVVALDPATL